MSLNKVILFICCSLFTISYAQQGNDIHSLLSKTPEQLEDYFSNITEEKRKSEITDSVLMEVKKSNNLDFRFKGYFLKLLENSHKPLSIKYADSILYVANRKNDNYIKALGNLYKGIQLYYQSEHVEALSYYLKAQQYFKQNKDEYYTIKIRHYIGLLKNASGNEKQALIFFKKNISFFEKDLKLKSKYGSQYIKSLFALGESYNRNSNLDSANVINKIGLKESLKLDKSMYPYFLLTYGATMYYMEKPELGIDSLLKATKYLNEKKNSLSDAYRLISLSYKKMDKDKSLLQYLLKIDSVHTLHPNTVLNAQWANSELYNYHKKIGNKEKQLENINKLLSIDSIVETKYSKLEKKITEGYDIPNLLSERENLISTLKKDSNSNQKTSFIFIFLSFSLLLVLFYFLRKNYILRRRFQSIIQDIDRNEQPKMADKIKEKEEPTKEQETTAQKPQKTAGISKDLTEKILLGLDKFEKSQRFTKKKYTLNSLAKELNTNSTYLSKVINLEKGTNFSNYLNNLKIDYAINRLTKDSKFRSYTIKAISEESGFNNQLTFSIAFNKKTKLQPSYFIKQLEKK
ncbi:AraC family transcriptional regulator [uncultured Tenacibaculum sp.]|uniref:helix-turn-helix domain-containing protein n=1 Tax=uncultured Tenacibaculum sp. TaxID=174713 RepID=UPI002604A7F9|nr:helix-turn-helix domain-containing protein [uncultured Tenacibaculum sp.]